MSGYHRPRTLDEALAIRAGSAVTVLAGGTDVYPARTARIGWGAFGDPDILDIGALAELRGIADEANSVRIGTLATWTDVKAADFPPAFAGLQAAARQVGGAQVQNRGTLAGNLCTASPAGDGIPCLLSLGASVEIASPGARRLVPVEDFVTGYRATALRPDELVTAIVVPKPRRSAVGGFGKLGARRYLVISIVMAAGVLEFDPDGRIAAARIAVGACSAKAERLSALEAALAGVTAREAADVVEAMHLTGLSPIDDIRASGAYRQDAALTLVRDLLSGLGSASERRAA